MSLYRGSIDYFPATIPFARSCLPMLDHPYLPSSSSSLYFLTSPQGAKPHSGTIMSTTQSFRSGSRPRSAARRSLSRKSYSSPMKSSSRSMSLYSSLACLPPVPNSLRCVCRWASSWRILGSTYWVSDLKSRSLSRR